MNDLTNLLVLAKQTLGIVSSATAKDDYIEMILKAGIKDIERVGITFDATNELHQSTLMTYLKANFGISNPLDKERFLASYQLQLAELVLSYRVEDTENE